MKRFSVPVVQEVLVIEKKKTNPRKSCGPDDVWTKVIQLCSIVFADNLTKIYEHSIEIWDYPSELKKRCSKGRKIQSKQLPVNKPLSCFNKLFGKSLCKSLIKFLERNLTSFNYQYGFTRHNCGSNWVGRYYYTISDWRQLLHKFLYRFNKSTRIRYGWSWYFAA